MTGPDPHPALRATLSRWERGELDSGFRRNDELREEPSYRSECPDS